MKKKAPIQVRNNQAVQVQETSSKMGAFLADDENAFTGTAVPSHPDHIGPMSDDTKVPNMPETAAGTVYKSKVDRAKSKKIAVEVYMVRAENKEIDVGQQEAGTTALTSPQNTENDIDVETAKKTQVETTAKTILATNTEARKIETHNKFGNKVAKIGTSNKMIQYVKPFRMRKPDENEKGEYD